MRTDTITGGVTQIMSSNFDDTLRGSDVTFESYRPCGGNDFIDGRGGRDRIDYRKQRIA